MRTRRAHLGVVGAVLACAVACGLDAVPGAPDDPNVGNAGSADAGGPDASASPDGGVVVDATTSDAAADAADATLPSTFDAQVPALDDGAIAPAADAAPGADASDAALPAIDGSVPASAWPLYLGDWTQLEIQGVTGDGYLVYLAPSGTSAQGYAVKIDGTEPAIAIGAVNSQIVFTGPFPGALFWSGCDSCVDASSCAPSCELTTWTASAGSHTAPVQTVSGFGWITPDGQNVLYAIDENANATTATLAGATIAFQNPVAYSQIALGGPYFGGPGIPGTCSPQVQSIPGHTLVAYCLPGSEAAELDSYAYPFTASSLTVLVPASEGVSPTFSLSGDGTVVGVLAQFTGSSGIPELLSTADGSILWQESGLSATEMTITPDAGTVDYLVVGNEAYIAEPAIDVTTIVAPNSVSILATAPNGQFVVTDSRSQTDAAAGPSNYSDLYLSPNADSSSFGLTSETNGFVGVPSAFTLDSNYVIYELYDSAQGTSSLQMRPVDGGAPLVLQPAVSAPADGVIATPPSGILYTDSQGSVVYDDTSKPFAPQLRVPGTFLAPGLYTYWSGGGASYLIFAYASGPQEGLYAMPALPSP